MGALRAAAICAILSLAGCTPRVLVQPHYVSTPNSEYVYFVEQIGSRDSRISKCDIAQDNSVRCQQQYDLK